jgi:cell wall-associated NlpC family hydrolase
LRLRIDATVLAALTLAGTPLVAQGGRDLDLLYGRWLDDHGAATYGLRFDAPLSGPFSHGVGFHILVHDTLGRRRAFYGAGWELHALRRRATLGPYLLAGAALGLSTDTARQALAALWDVGAGLEWRPTGWLGFGIEARYRLEDRGPRGFWRDDGARRGGPSVALGVTLGLRSGGDAARTAGAGRRGDAPPRLAVAAPAPGAIRGNAAEVVRTALDVLGTPYVWGGTAENGFDCSGLVQYAYASHGLRVPRTSRDQARAGVLVTPVLEALEPGDILLFSARPGGGVSHVGLYVGDQAFIHSSNSGVKLSRLDSRDPDGGWWVARWVGARRIVE